MNAMESPQLDNFLSVLHDSAISKKARLVYLDIKAESQLSHGEFYTSDKLLLAAKSGESERTIARALHELEKHNYIYRKTVRKGLDISSRTIIPLK